MFTKVDAKSDLIFVVNPKIKDTLQVQRGSKDPRADNEESHACILRVYLIFAHFLGISPFRIVRDQEGRNVARRWIIQMVICGLATVATIFARITDVRKAFPIKEKGEQWNPVVYFNIFYTVCSLGLTMNASWSLWMKSERFVDVVEFLDSSKPLPYRSSKIRYSILAVIICFIYAILGSLSAFFGSELMSSGSWTPFHWSRCLVLEGRYQFFLGPESNNCNRTVLEILETTTGISTWDGIMAGIAGLGQVFKFITTFYWKLFILFGVLSLWLPAVAFANSLQEDVGDDDDEEVDDDVNHESDERFLQAAAQWPVIEEQYLSLKDLSELINNAFGAMVFSYTFTSIFYYSINLDAFLLTTDILVRIRLIVLYLGAVILYILAADICRQISYLEIWLSEYADDEERSTVPFHRLTVILNELATSTIGVTGWNVFTITYSVVANMTSVLITYFIICVQFRSPTK